MLALLTSVKCFLWREWVKFKLRYLQYLSFRLSDLLIILRSHFIRPSCLLHWRYSVPLFSRLLFAWRYVVQFRWRCLWSNNADRNDPSKPRTSFARQTHWRIASPRNRGFFPYIFPSGKKINLRKLLNFF